MSKYNDRYDDNFYEDEDYKKSNKKSHKSKLRDLRRQANQNKWIDNYEQPEQQQYRKA